MEITEDNEVVCSRCGEAVPLEEAVAINKNRSLLRPLCEECLGAVGVPKGYDLIRDLSYLRR